MKKYVYTLMALSKKSIPTKKIIPAWTCDLVFEYIFPNVKIKMPNTVMFAIAMIAQYGIIVVNLSSSPFHLLWYRLMAILSKIAMFTSIKVER